MESCCGKSCASCMRYERKHCGGCGSDTPGYPDCVIVDCCRDKGHTHCDTCQNANGCQELGQRVKISARRQKLSRYTGILGTWLWVLFWMFIPLTLANLMVGSAIARENIHVLSQWAWFIGVCILISGLILLRLGKVSQRYHISGVLHLLLMVYLPLIILVHSVVLDILLLVLLVVTAIAAMYVQMTAHADVVYGISGKLEQQWYHLSKAYLAAYGIFAVCPVVVLVFQSADAVVELLVSVARVATAVVDVLYLIRLYRTARLFRGYCPKDSEEE